MLELIVGLVVRGNSYQPGLSVHEKDTSFDPATHVPLLVKIAAFALADPGLVSVAYKQYSRLIKSEKVAVAG